MRRKGAQGLTVDLPLLPPNTHRNPNKIICELCLEVEEERKRRKDKRNQLLCQKEGINSLASNVLAGCYLPDTRD